MVRGPRFEGARELDRLLRETSTSLPDWCKENGLERQRMAIQNLLNGEAKQGSTTRIPEPTWSLIQSLQTATHDRITPAMWENETLRWDQDDEVPGAKIVRAAESGSTLPSETPTATGTDSS